jgi:hypothetical protein
VGTACNVACVMSMASMQLAKHLSCGWQLDQSPVQQISQGSTKTAA